MANHEMVKKAITEFKNCHNADISACFSNVCKVLSLAGKQERNDGAEVLYRWAGKNASKHRLKFYYASCSRALYHFLNEEHEPALQLVIEAKELFEEQNDQVGIGCCLILMGCIYRTLGNRDLALKTLWEGSRKLKSGHCPHIQLAGSYHMGCIYFEMGSIEEAIHHFKEMEEPAEKSQDLIFINYALHGLGKVYLLQKKYPEAKEFFGKALNNAEDNRNALGVSASLTELAILHFQADDFTGAEELNKQALIVHEQNGFIAGAITNYIHLAEIYTRLLKHDEAMAMLYKGLQLAEQIKVKPKIYQIHFLLSEIYEGKKQFEKSLFHHKLFHEIRDQAEVEDNEKKLKNVQLIFEAEQTQKENEIIKKQKAEIERKNIELQETIDELTLAKVSKKARVITFVIAIVLFIVEDTILHFALHLVPDDNYLISLIVKIGIIFSLKPINGAVEHYLLKKVVSNKKQHKEVFTPAINLEFPHS